MTVNQNIYKFSEIIHNNPELSVEFFTDPQFLTYHCIVWSSPDEHFGSSDNSMFDAFMEAYEKYQNYSGHLPYYFGEDT